MSLEQFQIVATNPNDRIGGGGCLCSPSQKTSACKGPFVLFPNAEVAGAPEAGLHNSPHAVASVACVCAAAKASTGEVLSTAPSTVPSDEPDIEWDELSEYEQLGLQTQFPKGGLTKLLNGKRVLVPPAPPDWDIVAPGTKVEDDPVEGTLEDLETGEVVARATGRFFALPNAQ